MSLRDILMAGRKSKGSKEDVFTFRLSREATDKFWRLDSSLYVYADTKQADAENMPSTVFTLEVFGAMDDGTRVMTMSGVDNYGNPMFLGFDAEGYLVAAPFPAVPMSLSFEDGTQTAYVCWGTYFLEWTSDGRMKLTADVENDNSKFLWTILA